MLYKCCPDPYPDVTFTIIMKRRPMFYLFHLLFPCVLLTAIGLMTFCLPPESGEKVSLAVTVLLAMTVFMLVIMENIPPTSEVVPLFGGYAFVCVYYVVNEQASTHTRMRVHARTLAQTHKHIHICSTCILLAVRSLAVASRPTEAYTVWRITNRIGDWTDFPC